MVSSEGSNVSKLIHMILDRINCLKGCWPEGLISLLAIGWNPPLVPFPMASPRAAQNMASCFIRESTGEEPERDYQQDKSHSALWSDFGIDIPSFCHSLFVRSKWLGLAHTQGAGFHESMRQRSLGAISKAAYHKQTILWGLNKIMAVKIFNLECVFAMISPQGIVFALIFNLNSCSSKLTCAPNLFYNWKWIWLRPVSLWGLEPCRIPEYQALGLM